MFVSPVAPSRFGPPGSARESIDDASLVSEARRRLGAKLHRDGNRYMSSARRSAASSASATASAAAASRRRAEPPPRPDFDLDLSTPSDGRFLLGAPASPVYTPVARAHGADAAAARFAEAHRRAVMEPSPVSVRFRAGTATGAATGSPGLTRDDARYSERRNPYARRESPEGKHGLQLVRETLASELDWARG